MLQGLRKERKAALVERALCRFNLASRAAAKHRLLRGVGIKVRKAADLIIGTFCIERDHALLHNDRDFLSMQAHLGLRVMVADPGETAD